MSVNQGSVNFFSPAALVPVPPTLSASNGVHIDFDTIKLGGNLYENTSIVSTGATFLLKGFNVSYYLDSDQIMAGSIFEFNGDKDGMLLHVGKGSGSKNVFHVDKRHPTPTEISRTYFEVDGTNETISFGIVEGTLGLSPINKFTLDGDGWSNKFSDINNNVFWDFKHVESDNALSSLSFFDGAIQITNNSKNLFRRSVVVDWNLGVSEFNGEFGEVSQFLQMTGGNCGIAGGAVDQHTAIVMGFGNITMGGYDLYGAGYQPWLTIDDAGMSLVNNFQAKTIQTTGSAGSWKLGSAMAGAGLTIKTTQYIAINISGIDYKLALVN